MLQLLARKESVWHAAAYGLPNRHWAIWRADVSLGVSFRLFMLKRFSEVLEPNSRKNIFNNNKKSLFLEHHHSAELSYKRLILNHNKSINLAKEKVQPSYRSGWCALWRVDVQITTSLLHLTWGIWDILCGIGSPSGTSPPSFHIPRYLAPRFPLCHTCIHGNTPTHALLTSYSLISLTRTSTELEQQMETVAQLKTVP